MITRMHYLDWLSSFCFAVLAMHYQINQQLGFAILFSVACGICAWVANKRITERLFISSFKRLFVNIGK